MSIPFSKDLRLKVALNLSALYASPLDFAKRTNLSITSFTLRRSMGYLYDCNTPLLADSSLHFQAKNNSPLLSMVRIKISMGDCL